MRIAIFGAGAIGGTLAVKLHQAGASVTVIARGAHLAAMQEHGLTLRSEEGAVTVRLPCTDKAEDAGPQDYVIATLKATSLPSAAPHIAKLMGHETALVTAINGIPYWYFYGQEGPWRNRIIESVDPGGTVWAQLPPHRAIGCIVYPAAEVIQPGVIAHAYGNRFSLGEPDGSKSPRVLALSQILTQAGLKAPVRTSIRDEIWVKLWGNAAFNPISALTGSTLERLAFGPDLRAVVRGMMEEMQVVGEALGATFSIAIDKRIDGAGEVGAHKTSMLQDLERGRPIEIDALLGAVVELAALTGTDAPLCRAILALVRERARLAGCYPA
ncbi:MAG TPA: 2-dehydropantoate 2-reductase [Rhizomicrobium sp.]|nr:2-dehydropantoate 2-reductase [Rhizomicrobium sp.]